MGRRKKNPHDEKAQGNPGRRKSKTEHDIEAMEERAKRDAELFASAGDDKDLQALPVFLSDPRLAAAQVIWREYAPRLDRLNFLSTLDRHTFAMFCIYAAEFVLANKECLDNGFTIMVTTVAGAKSKGKGGDKMPRKNPAADRRDYAADMMIDLSAKFGLTPLDRLRLMSAGAKYDDETLFGRQRQPAAGAPAPKPDGEPAPEPEPDAGASRNLIGSMSSFDSSPPNGKLPN